MYLLEGNIRRSDECLGDVVVAFLKENDGHNGPSEVSSGLDIVLMSFEYLATNSLFVQVLQRVRHKNNTQWSSTEG